MGRVLGYARVSTDDGQDVSTQKNRLEELGAVVVFSDVGNGSSLAGRDQLEAVLRLLEPGDVLMTLHPDRLARDTADLLSIAKRVVGKKAVLRIVDPETLEVLPEGRVGEIWTSGPTVSPGYFHLPEATAETFGLSLPGEDRSFMRTGDLAAILDGQVYVTGRLKEMIIVRGRNLYPQDLEAAARTASPAVGIGAAFELTGAASVAGLVIEIDDDELSASGDTLDEVVRKVKDVVMSRFSLPSLAVATLPLNLLPRTPSGKVRRGPTRLALQAGELPTTSAVGFAPSTHS